MREGENDFDRQCVNIVGVWAENFLQVTGTNSLEVPEAAGWRLAGENQSWCEQIARFGKNRTKYDLSEIGPILCNTQVQDTISR